MGFCVCFPTENIRMSKIDEKYRIANFEVKNIKQETKPWSYKRQTFTQFKWASWDFITFKWWKNIMIRNCLIMIIYLALHVVIQQTYQHDHFCPDVIKAVIGGNKNGDNSHNSTTNNFAPLKRTERAIQCQEWASEWFGWWNKKMKNMLKVITFLVGFYVSTLTARWWEQIKGIPTPADLNVQLASVVKMGDDEALHFKKKIIRYVHLSWTLVMTQRNKKLFNLYSEDVSLINKDLLTHEEGQCLELGRQESGATSYQSLWYVPLNWASIMIKKAKNDGKLGDPKEILNDIHKYEVGLGHILQHKYSKLPVIFSQAVWVAVTVWMFVTLIGAQNTDHWSEDESRAHTANRQTAFTLPGHELFTVILICSWLQAADKLYNPFQENRGFSVNLEE